MTDKPSKPSGIWALKVDGSNNPIYFAACNSVYIICIYSIL